MHVSGRDNRDQSELKFYECSRVKKGFSGICIHVISGSDKDMQIIPNAPTKFMAGVSKSKMQIITDAPMKATISSMAGVSESKKPTITDAPTKATISSMAGVNESKMPIITDVPMKATISSMVVSCT
jgi:hypothetical protein